MCRTLLSLLLFSAFASAAEPQPRFQILAIWDGCPHADDTNLPKEMDRLVAQFGKGGNGDRIGFSFIHPGKDRLRRVVKLASEKGLAIGVILAIQTHTNGKFRAFQKTDLRLYQWRANGEPGSWKGYYTGANNAGKQEITEDSRDHLVVTPSRYAQPVRDMLVVPAGQQAKEIREVMNEFPGVITIVNPVIEEELAIAAASLKEGADGWLADHSPFAVTEFRDWLRHSGEYDAEGGAYAGQGAPEAITGGYIDIRGKKRSPFYDDPTPADAAKTGDSFNAKFGTSFTSWKLRYWDMEAFPAAITDAAFDPTPEQGAGSVEGGFDAPRKREPGNAFWRAWSWDIGDQGGKFPPGYPKEAAFGFRQTLVAHFVRDVSDAAADKGIPRECIFAHQIPGERYGPRGISSASTIWSGWLPASGTVGVTLFGRIETERLKAFQAPWGIFEWHPKPNAKPEDPKLRESALRDLRDYAASGCKVLFPGWWRNEGRDRHIFPLDDSEFANAIHDFLAERAK